MTIIMRSIRIFWLLFFLILNVVKSELSIELMLGPMCEARCLELFKNKSGHLQNKTIVGNYQPFLIKTFCVKDMSCVGCMSACGVVKKSIDKCINNCKTTISQSDCVESCRFLEWRRQNRPGYCDNRLTRYKCGYRCSHDSDCYKIGTKCCHSVRCNKECRIALLPKEDVPPVPQNIVVKQVTSTEDSREIHLDLDWSSYSFRNINYPVVFEVQLRSGRINEAGTEVIGSWTHALSTTKTGLILTDLILEPSYQFRVIAFSQYGYLGIGKNTPPITIHYKPSTIPIPKNLSEVLTRIVYDEPNGQFQQQNPLVSVTVSWSVGEYKSMIPVSRFRIVWRKFKPGNENDKLVKVFESYVPGTQSQYNIKNLQPSTTYQVKVRSIIEYRNRQYNSSAATIFVTTIPRPSDEQSDKRIMGTHIKQDNHHMPTDNRKCYCDNRDAAGSPVQLGKFQLIDGSLSNVITVKDIPNSDQFVHLSTYTFRIQWYPLACIESPLNSASSPAGLGYMLSKPNENHIISELQFRCNYRLEVSLLPTASDHLAIPIKKWSDCFCTPNCKTDLSIEPNRNSQCYVSSLYIPPLPQNLRVNPLYPNSSSPLVKIEWTIDDANVVSKFRITWGPRLKEPIDKQMYSSVLQPILDADKATCKVIYYPTQSITLSNLERDVIYVVRVESLHNKISSKPSTVHFSITSDYNSGAFIRPRFMISLYFCITTIVLITR